MDMEKTFYIIDDHEMLRVGTAAYIAAHSDWRSCGNAGDGDTAPADFESNILLSTSASKKEIICGKCNQFVVILHVFHELIEDSGCKSSEYDATAFQSKIMTSIRSLQENR